jgi:hypothetical protein
MGHSILQIVKGIQKVPGDTLSAETGLDSIDLLDPLGFSTDTYEIKIPSLKSSAVYADSPLSDGRTLIAGALGNVNETIRVTLTTGTIVQLSAMLSKLLRFKKDCNDFWDTFTQIEPVYIKHQVDGEPGPRYALLYDIDIAIDSVVNPGDPQRDITIVIERETYWRGLAPGDNPKKWTVENYFTGQTWSPTNASLYSGIDHLAYGLVDNCQEFLTNTSFQSRNFIDIPAEKIPGDAPPLLCVMVNGGLNNPKHYIGVSQNRTSIVDRASSDLLLYNAIPMSSGTIASGTAAFLTDTTRGVAHVPTSPLKRTVIVTPAGATEVIVLTWNVTSFPHFNALVLNGRYAVFLRANQIGGTAQAVTARFTWANSGAGTIFDSGLRLIGDDSTAENQMNYMGIIEFPTTASDIVGANGKGATTEVDSAALSVSVMRSAGVGTVRLVDLILYPLGNFVTINHNDGGAGVLYSIYDDTGYFSHGRIDPVISAHRLLNDVDQIYATEGNGQLQLKPGVNNRLYLTSILNSGGGATANIDMTVRANIVPRWSGLRDK